MFFRRGVLVFVRYTESNVGPYDELLWLELFQCSPAGRAHHVPVIFVSSEASAQSGRANWGLPKEVAEFHVSARDADTVAVQVTCAGQPIASFVHSGACGGLPLALGRLPRALRRLVQVSEGRAFDTVPEARARFRPARVCELEVNRHLSSFELLFPAARIVDLR